MQTIYHPDISKIYTLDNSPIDYSTATCTDEVFTHTMQMNALVSATDAKQVVDRIQAKVDTNGVETQAYNHHNPLDIKRVTTAALPSQEAVQLVSAGPYGVTSTVTTTTTFPLGNPFYKHTAIIPKPSNRRKSIIPRQSHRNPLHVIIQACRPCVFKQHVFIT